jgi:hypothetical protein
VFDTWSANNDPQNIPVLPQKVPYHYGVDPGAVDIRDNVPLTAKATSPADPDYANWNNNHFYAPAAVQQRTPAPPPTVPRWVPPIPPVGNQPGTPGAPTEANTNIPLRVRVRAIQIKLRIWDRKTNQTRQVTMIQDV